MNRKIYFMCPRYKTGGPENAHQLCDYLNSIGAEAYMFYFPNEHGNHEPLYPEFANIRVSDRIEDNPENIVVVPEIYRISDAKVSFQRATIAMWWLSYTNACLFNVLDDNIKASGQAVHLFHSYYEYAMVRPHLAPSTKWFFLTDYIHDDYLALDPASYLDEKQDIVCFNGNKDKITASICQAAGIPYISITNMSKDQVMQTLRKCKVYVDNGFHPGKDHMPREAAMHGCVVITNKCGSAAYAEDVPIEEKVSLETELYDLIPRVMSNYRSYFGKQESYREKIRNEKAVSHQNAREFARAMAEDLT